MMIFGRPQFNRPDLVVETANLVIRPPLAEDFAAWARVRAESRRFLQPWEPTWPADDLTHAAFKQRIRRYHAEIEEDTAYPFLIFRLADRQLLGGLNLTNIRRGAASAASLGYWMGETHAGRGVMTEAVRAVTRFAFSGMTLNRVEAACLPDNAASIRLLRKAGFRAEGEARDYLSINGAWRDHLLFALLARDIGAAGAKP
jgi:[ribosomal protein S5]-alanine N-acetyltransferase